MKFKKIGIGVLSCSTLFSNASIYVPIQVQAAEVLYEGALNRIEQVEYGSSKNIILITYNDNVKAKLTFLEEGIFRYNIDPSATFDEYAKPIDPSHTAKIQQYPDTSNQYSHPEAQIVDHETSFEIKCGKTSILLDKATSKMLVKSNEKIVLEEKEPIQLSKTRTTQTLTSDNKEFYYGGGTQNGRFSHKNEIIQIENSNNWVDGGVSSPNPFYWSSDGYGVLRNTFQKGTYDFGKGTTDSISTSHEENEFDAYYFISDEGDINAKLQDILQSYYKVTGNPVLLPEYGFYLGHLNCYNRDGWSDQQLGNGGAWTIKENQPATSNGTTTYEYGRNDGYILDEQVSAETLNGVAPTVGNENFRPKDTNRKYSAQAVIDTYQKNDMPLGWLLPNDGYGCGYGQNGYQKTGGVNADGSSSPERIAAIDANVKNLQAFSQYANAKGVNTGLWTQSQLTPDSNPNTQWQKLRDFEKEVKIGGVTTLKTDVAWVGPGYSFGLNGIKFAYDTISENTRVRPNIVTVDGWAGTQRFGSIWTGDQYGGDFEYIRFHIPTYIGQGLSGNPNVGSDMDGIFGGNPIISARDYQWKAFTPQILDMDGWGSYMKAPYTHGDPYSGISRLYLKLKAQMMPYSYTLAAAAANINTQNQDQGYPMIRSMFLEYPNDEYAYSKDMQYQYMWGDSFLVAPIYQNTQMQENGDDVRHNIYLPGGESQIWIDYFTGKQYRGGQVLNYFDAPLWKLPLFVKNGAIIPMYEEHNNPEKKTETNPGGLDKSKRIIEFYPSGQTQFYLYEDDGKSVTNTTKEENGYGKVDNIDYNGHVTTKITSSVEQNKAILTLEPSTGSYQDYQANKDTTFIVNVSQKPSSIKVLHGSSNLTIKEVQSKAEFDQASSQTEAIYFYDEKPNLNAYASEGEFSKVKIETTPKLYVKLPKVNVQQQQQQVIVEGFVNDGNLEKNQENASLQIPTFAEVNDDHKTPTSVSLSWNAVDQATSYELKVDGTIYKMGNQTTYHHQDLPYHSTHRYQVRSRNQEGYSKWSDEIIVTTLEDPWRNVPEPVTTTWEGGYYNNQKENIAFDHQLGGEHFHSDANAIGKSLTMDYGKAFVFDKFEYHPRNDGGNGTVTSMRIETSLDGKHWTSKEVSWERNGLKKEVLLDQVAAQYIRLTPLASVGNFFSAVELAAYKMDGTTAFEVGSNLMKEQVGEGDYSNMKNYLGVEGKGNTKDIYDSQIKAKYADLNINNRYDVYDYAFTMAKLDGGSKQTGAVQGDLIFLSNQQHVKKGDVIEIDLYAVDVKNANAVGGLFDYASDAFEFVDGSVRKSAYLSTMEDLSIYKAFGDGTATVNLAFANRGDKKTFSGTGLLASFQLRAKKDGEVPLKQNITLVGPKLDSIEKTTKEDVEIPEVPTRVTVEYEQNDFDITMTNDVLNTDDGSNVTKLLQNGGYESLFNQVKEREFEFKWDLGDNRLEDYIKVPTTLHFQFKEMKPLTKVVVSNADSKGNGYVQKLEISIVYEDDTTETYTFENEAQDYTYDLKETKKVKKINVTPKQTVGLANASNEPRENRMLTLGEIDFIYENQQEVDEIVLDEHNPKELYTQAILPIQAHVKPDNLQNKYYKVTSSNPEIAEVLSFAHESEVKYFVKGNKEGTSTLTFTSVLDESKSVSYDIVVKNGVDKTNLMAAIDQANQLSETIYTQDSYQKLKAALQVATEIAKKPDATHHEVIDATVNLNNAMQELVFKPANPENEIRNDRIRIAGGSSEIDEGNGQGLFVNVLDRNTQTMWHSDYINHLGMPQYLIFDFQESIPISHIQFLPRQDQGINGDIFTFEVYVSDQLESLQVNAKTNDVHYAGSFTFANDGVKLLDRDQYKQASFPQVYGRYLKLKITQTGGTQSNQFASASEFKFFFEQGKAVDFTKLRSLVTSYEALALKKEEFTEETFIVFENAMEDAKRCLEKLDATQAEIDSCYERLYQAYHNLKRIEEHSQITLEKLLDLMKQAELFEERYYTSNSWKQLQAALELTKSILAMQQPTQEQIEHAYRTLSDAIQNLKRVQTTTVEGNANTIQHTGANSSDTTNIGLPMMFVVLSSGCIVYLMRKKQHEETKDNSIMD